MTKSMHIIAALSSACLMAMAGAAHAADVDLTLTGLKDGGTLYVSLQTAEQFMQEDGTGGETINNVEAGDVSVTLDVPPGTYALSIWHDVNDNGEFDMAEQGWPEDGWAAYNGTSLVSTPSFGQVSFEVTEDGFSLTEPMIYPEFYEKMMSGQ